MAWPYPRDRIRFAPPVCQMSTKQEVFLVMEGLGEKSYTEYSFQR